MPMRCLERTTSADQNRAAPGLLLAMCLLAFSSVVLPGKADAAPPGERCDKENAETVYSSGMEQYGRRQYQKAIPEIEEAAALCPAPKSSWSVTVQFLGEYPFLPFFFLGKCHLNLKDLPEALRHFYLSSCADEPVRNKEKAQELNSLTNECRQRLESKQRPQQHPYFSAGFAASQQKDWEAAAEKMWDALQVWEEDGRTTISSGRWPAPYLPRFRLAEALFELGCYREACDQLDQSLLKQLHGREVEADRQRLEKLRPACELKKRQPYQEKEICQQWRCWLQQGGPR